MAREEKDLYLLSSRQDGAVVVDDDDDVLIWMDNGTQT